MELTKEQTVLDIKPFLLKESDGVPYYLFLNIVGGYGDSDNKKRGRSGGDFTFILFYAEAGALKDCDKCERIWCEQNKIVYGEGNTIEEAYQDYLNKTK